MDRRIVDLVNKSDIKKLQCLLATGAKLQHARDNNGCNLLHLAVFSRQVESIKWIVENLPELLIKKNLAGRTPLHSACKPIFGLDIIRPLVKNGQALEIGDDDAQRTPLHYVAADCEGLEVTEFLLSCGANINVVDKKGISVLQAAIRAGNLDTVKLLLESGANTQPIDFLSVNIVMHWPILQKMLEHFPSGANSANSDGYTLLMRVARYGGAVKVKELLECGADHSMESSRGTNALMEAIRAGDLESVRLLLHAGADPTKQDKEGNNVLNLACESAFNAKEMLSLLHEQEAFQNNTFKIASEHLHPLGVVLRKKRSVELLEYMIATNIFCDRYFVFHEDFFNINLLKIFDTSYMALSAIGFLLHNPETNLITDEITLKLLNILLENNFPVNSFNDVIPPLTILLSCNSNEIENMDTFTGICKLLITKGANVHDMSLCVVEREPRMKSISLVRKESFLPDALLMPCLTYNLPIIKMFRHHWAASPLGLLSILHLDYAVSKYFHMAKHELPLGTAVCREVSKTLQHLQDTNTRYGDSTVSNICSHFRDLTSSPPSLLTLAKYAVRFRFAQCALHSGGTSMCQAIQQTIWPPNLRDIVLLLDECDEPEVAGWPIRNLHFHQVGPVPQLMVLH